MIKVIEAKNKKQMKLFATFPVKLYKDCPYYVPSFVEDEMNLLNKKKNLSLGNSEVKCFLAYKDDVLVGRISGIINHDSNKKNNEKCIRFSRIDMIDDLEVTKALLKAVNDYGKSNGLEIIQGPWGFDDADREGMLTYGYEEYSSFATAYSFPYYKEHMEKLGYQKESEWVENRFNLKDVDPRFFKIADILRGKGYSDLSEKYKPAYIVKKYADALFDCYNRAYAELDNFIPLKGKARKQVVKTFASILNQRYFSVIVNKEHKVVAFGVGLPYIGEAVRNAKGRSLKALPAILKTIKKPRKIEFALIGVDPDYRNSGAHALIVDRFIKNAREDKIEDAFLDPTLTTNLKMLNTWQGMGKEERCRRQTYRKEIE